MEILQRAEVVAAALGGTQADLPKAEDVVEVPTPLRKRVWGVLAREVNQPMRNLLEALKFRGVEVVELVYLALVQTVLYLLVSGVEAVEDLLGLEDIPGLGALEALGVLMEAAAEVER